MKKLVAVAAALLALLFAASAGAATLRLTPAQAGPGSVVTAVGSGFPGSRAGTLTLGGRVVAGFATSGRGAFTKRFRVPRLSRGPKRAVASTAGGRVASVFTIGRPRSSSVTANSSGQRMLLAPTSGKTGSWVNVNGSGFGSGARVRISFAGAVQRSVRANARGAFAATSARFRLPPSALGVRAVGVRAGRRALSAPYRVVRCGATSAYLPVCTPYMNEFAINAGGFRDAHGIGTGFNVVSPYTPGGSTGYVRANLNVNRSAGTLSIATTDGLASGATNTQDNMLGVGIAPGNGPAHISTTILNPPNPAAGGTNEQAGLWFGNDQDNYVKLILLNTAGGPVVQLRMEVNGAGSGPGTKAITLPAGKLQLSLTADPESRAVKGVYSINGSSPVTVGTVNAPSAFFSSDQAGIDPAIGTKTFTGIFASHRNGPNPLTYTFGDFSLLVDPPPPPPPPPGGFTFNRFSIGATGVSNATAMAFGPDGRLYVTELMGTIHALTLNSAHKVTADQVITDLGTNLTLGIAVDPASTSSNVILWIAYSSPELSSPDPTTGIGGAPANSGAVAKIVVGAGSSTRLADPITGLPRSQANHATNAVHFKGGKLYIAQSGNTGAGAPNNSNASRGEFGLREEQPLSAAILVADVKAAGFDGSCSNTTDIYGPAPCDVHPYATGFRNAYDFVSHSNGSMYAPDNGASVGPTYPKSPTPPCGGLSPTSNNPGDQNDPLMRVVAGKYYGHPNPNRIEPNGPECVFKDGTLQGVPPLSWYQDPIADLGPKRSADGIIEYRGNAFGGALNGNLLITYYSQGDFVARVQLSGDGTSVVGSPTNLAGGFNNPLPITEGPDGTIYVGEFGDPGAGNPGKITALVPTG